MCVASHRHGTVVAKKKGCPYIGPDSNLELDNSMDLKELRLEKGWSQEQLAEISGVSTRTVQRLEKGEKPGMETLKALAAAFETSSTELQKKLNGDMEQETMNAYKTKLQSALDYGWKGLLIHLGIFMAFITWLFILSANFGMDDELIGFVAILWGTPLVLHALKLLGVDDV